MVCQVCEKNEATITIEAKTAGDPLQICGNCYRNMVENGERVIRYIKDGMESI